MVQVNDAVIAESDVIDLRRFLSEFRTKLLESKTDKALIRMIFDSLQAFGPGATGSNLLINRFIKKEESILFRIERLLNSQQQRNLEESKVPQAALSLAAANSTENNQVSKHFKVHIINLQIHIFVQSNTIGLSSLWHKMQ